MFANLLGKEISQQLVSAKFAVITVLVLLLAVASSVVMLRDYQLRMDNYELLAPKDNDTVAIKRPVPMSVLIKGLDERMGRSMSIDVIGTIDVGTSQSSATRLFALFRELDLHFVALVILSLAAVLFSFDMVSGEKRRGTLKMALANGVSRSTVLLAKGLGALLVVAIPALIALIIGLLFIAFAVPGGLTPDVLARTASFGGTLLLYLATFISIGLLISCLTHRPAISLVFAMLTWALLVFVVPNTAALAGRLIAGGEGLEQQEVKVRHIWTSRIFEIINNPEERPEDGSLASVYTEMANEEANEYRAFVNTAEQRVGWVRLLSYFSPAGPFSFASWAAAGTGPEDELEFKRSVLRYHPVAIEDAAALLQMARNFEGAPEEFKARSFEEQPRDLGNALSSEILPADALLVGMTLILFVIAFFAFARFDVR